MKRAVSLALLALSLFGVLGPDAMAAMPAFRTISKTETSHVKRILLVFAHPDDETMMGGTLLKLKELGVEVRAVYATAGEGGKRVVLMKGKPIEERAPSTGWLAQVRKGELARALTHFGVKVHELLGQPDAPTRFADGKPAETGTEFLSRGDWDVHAIEHGIVRAATAFRPDVVITLLPDNKRVHPHHQAIAIITRRLFQAGKLGPTAKQLYGLEETVWYSPDTFQSGALDEAQKVRFDTSKACVKNKKITYASYAAKGASMHKSQMVGYKGEVPGYEVFVPLGLGDNLLMSLLTPTATARRAAKIRPPAVRKSLPKTFKVKRGAGWVPR